MQFVAEPEHGEFLGFCFNFDSEATLSPTVWKITEVDIVVMSLRFWSIPAFQRAGDMKEWLAAPGESAASVACSIVKPSDKQR